MYPRRDSEALKSLRKAKDVHSDGVGTSVYDVAESLLNMSRIYRRTSQLTEGLMKPSISLILNHLHITVICVVFGSAWTERVLSNSDKESPIRVELCR